MLRVQSNYVYLRDSTFDKVGFTVSVTSGHMDGDILEWERVKC